VLWGARVLLVDAAGYDPLRLIWRVGHVIAGAGRFTHRLYVRSWEEALERLCALAAQQLKLSELQFWGHGAPGQVLLGRDVLDAQRLMDCALFQRWAAMRPFQPHSAGLIWFRTCYTMKGDEGRAFATALCEQLQCRVAGYTQYIHVLQRGLVVKLPSQPAEWADEGLATPTGTVLFWSLSPPTLSPIWPHNRYDT
jgi:hypothetical protein